jgi:hypothetical protein
MVKITCLVPVAARGRMAVLSKTGSFPRGGLFALGDQFLDERRAARDIFADHLLGTPDSRLDRLKKDGAVDQTSDRESDMRRSRRHRCFGRDSAVRVGERCPILRPVPDRIVELAVMGAP